MFGKNTRFNVIWVKVFKSGPSKICERQPSKKFKKAVLYGPFLNNLTQYEGVRNINVLIKED